MRMIYDPATKSFTADNRQSLMYVRNFTKPYGWIKESGTPPQEHWDCILMTENEYELGDEVPIKVIGLFKRKCFRFVNITYYIVTFIYLFVSQYAKF